MVILRLHAQENIGTSFIAVLERYSQQLKAHGGKLILTGVHPKVKGQLDRTGTTGDVLGVENVFEAMPAMLAASTRAGLAAAEQWLEETPSGAPLTLEHVDSIDGRPGKLRN